MNEKAVNDAQADVIYGLNDKPPVPESLFAALQHLLAIFVGIITPPIIICGALKVPLEAKAYVINMALFVSGLATFIQIRRIGPIGSGILSIQGTSFTFLGTIIAIGIGVQASGGDYRAALATIFGVCFVGAFVEMFFSRFITHLRKFIPPLVSGIVVTMIGLSLIRVGIADIGGGTWLKNNKPEFFATAGNLILAAIVLAIIIICNRSGNRFVRMGSIAIGLIVGYVIASLMGMVPFARLAELSPFAPPIPFKYGFFGFDWGALIPIALLYLITTVESLGDLTATSLVSGEPIEGDVYMKRISGGIFGDGFNSALAAIFNSFPNTTFSQNNGVIQMTGVASRHVGYYIAGMLALVGMFPIVGGIFSIIPAPVLGGATIIMFGTVAAAGVRIIASSKIDRRAILIMAVSFGAGLGVIMVPEILSKMPKLIQSIFGSAITTGGIAAIFMNLVLPQSKD